MNQPSPAHGLPAEIVAMIRGEIGTAILGLKQLLVSGHSERLTAVVVLLSEIQPEFDGLGRKPWRAVPWLDCASALLQREGDTRTNSAREHVSAARDLLERD